MIGFVGLDNTGGPMAANLVEAGHVVTGLDLNPDAVGRGVRRIAPASA